MGTGPNEIIAAIPPSPRVAVIGRGRAGTAFAAALRDAGLRVDGPLGRGERIPGDAGVVLLCVPDAQIAALAAELGALRAGGERAPAPFVGHCSGATGLEPLFPQEGFSLHPLMTLAGARSDVERLRGCPGAIAASSPRALRVAASLARAIGMQPIELAAADRAAYHAAATIASNFLVTLEGAAETLAASAGLSREQLVPLVQASVANWAASGARAALTGPVARGDEATVARQREAIEVRAPELLALFDALCDATRALAADPMNELVA